MIISNKIINNNMIAQDLEDFNDEYIKEDLEQFFLCLGIKVYPFITIFIKLSIFDVPTLYNSRNKLIELSQSNSSLLDKSLNINQNLNNLIDKINLNLDFFEKFKIRDTNTNSVEFIRNYEYILINNDKILSDELIILGSNKHQPKAHISANNINNTNNNSNSNNFSSNNLNKKSSFNNHDNSNHISNQIFASFIVKKQITSIDNKISILNLRYLYLEGNYIQVIPESIESLTNLKLLDLKSNFIRNMKNINLLTNLEELNLSNNMINNIEAENPSLKKLSLHDQRMIKSDFIERIDLDCLFLQELNLENSKVRSIEGISLLNNLVILNLKQNYVEEKNEFLECISLLTNLMELDIRNNPVCNLKNMKDLIILKSESLLEYNLITITENERKYISHMYKNKIRK